ncbi:peroxiredoxin [Brumimicrobium aurantiacum]|uniref:thioredoxin-dependent peroxiredoxin n=1 Tax=Brumimicrobium aurantiacum TaxID=1737063 RepID=A0A3E1F1S2_9FLAO|nr:peroxiredoxin [Brumimicrobium aurantiacum]RFC55755.1 peroxiredoxin [Brumimicrobium aurantiacum]
MSKSIEVGDQCPLFSLKDQEGKAFNIEEVLGKENIIIYFYPKDDTPGCTKQACSFRDAFEDFTKADAKVIGISSDNEESHKKFAQKHQLPFTLLADTQKSVRKAFGVPTNLLGLIPGRVTYVVDKKGIVQGVFNSQMKVEQHVDEALSILEKAKS